MSKDWGFYYTFTTNLKRVRNSSRIPGNHGGAGGHSAPARRSDFKTIETRRNRWLEATLEDRHPQALVPEVSEKTRQM
jgi:hypothetical protein